MIGLAHSPLDAILLKVRLQDSAHCPCQSILYNRALEDLRKSLGEEAPSINHHLFRRVYQISLVGSDFFFFFYNRPLGLVVALYEH
jgi:hypothetical protein